MKVATKPKKSNGSLFGLNLPSLMPMHEFARQPRAYSDLLPYAVKIADDVILNVDGSMMATYNYRGSDMAMAGHEAMGHVARRVNDALRRFGPGWMFHFHSERKPAIGYPSGSEFPDPTSAVIDAVRRTRHEEINAHYTNDYWADITYLPPTDAAEKGSQFLMEGQKEIGAAHAAKDAQKTFEENIRAFEGMLGLDMHMRRVGVRVIDEDEGPVEVDEQVSHLIKCATNRDILIRKLPAAAHISPLVACSPLRGGTRLRIGDEVVSVLLVSDMPAVSFPGMFDMLNQQQSSYRATWRFIVRDPMLAIKDIEKARRTWFGKRRGMADSLQGKEGQFHDIDAVTMAEDANLAAAMARSGEVLFGYYTMSIVFWEKIHPGESEDEAWARLTKTREGVAAAIHRMHFQTFHEEWNAVEAFLGTLPGIGHAQLRRPMLSSRNLADFIPTTAVWTGSPECPCDFYPPDSPPLAYVSTNGSTPFCLNIHVGQVGHFLVTGQTGAGKSVLLGFLLAQHRRYPTSRQIVFDVGRSHYTLCESVGGLHYEVLGDSKLRFCPLAHIDDPAERQWAEGWLLMLLAESGLVANPREKREQIFKALVTLARSGPPYSLTNLMRQPFLDKDVIEALELYCVGGNTDGILDGESNDIDEADFLCFEMGALMDDAVKSLRTPLLAYMFHMVERMCTGRPTLIVLEEVWTFLDNEQSAEAIKKWLKTMRKMNAAVGFANQSLVEFINSPIADTLISNCLTKILLANPNAGNEAAMDAYRKIGLSKHQCRQLARAVPQRDYFFFSPEGRRIINLELTKVELAFIGVSEQDRPRVRKMVEDERAVLLEHADLDINQHVPWQASWLATKVGGETGQGWARHWLEAWQAQGGYQGPLYSHLRKERQALAAVQEA